MSGRLHRFHRPLVLASLFASAAVTAVAADVPRSRADADQMLRKIAVITTNGLAARPAARRTPITESELNSFLSIHARSEMPPGVLDPVVTIDSAGRLTGRAIVDLDEVKRAQRSEGMSVLSLLSGRVPVEATGVLHAAAGKGKFDLETATVNGVPVPKSILQQVVSYYSRTPENPAGIDLEAPFELPVGIREITTQKGQALIVQ
jgi:hypothetical protein